MDEGWIAWFAEQGLSPLSINYEDLSEHPLEITGNVLEQLNLSKELVREAALPVSKLSDSINKQWASRFYADNRTKSNIK